MIHLENLQRGARVDCHSKRIETRPRITYCRTPRMKNDANSSSIYRLRAATKARSSREPPRALRRWAQSCWECLFLFSSVLMDQREPETDGFGVLWRVYAFFHNSRLNQDQFRLRVHEDALTIRPQ